MDRVTKLPPRFLIQYGGIRRSCFAKFSVCFCLFILFWSVSVRLCPLILVYVPCCPFFLFLSVYVDFSLLLSGFICLCLLCIFMSVTVFFFLYIYVRFSPFLFFFCPYLIVSICFCPFCPCLSFWGYFWYWFYYPHTLRDLVSPVSVQY